MEPAAPLVGEAGDLDEWIERPRVDVARLDADDRGAVARFDDAGQSGGFHAALRIDLDAADTAASQAQKAAGRVDGDMRLRAGDDLNLRCTVEPFPLEIPTGPAQHLVTRRGEAGEVCHLAAGDGPDTR